MNDNGRRNLPNFVRAELALKLKPVVAEKARGEGYRNRESNKSSLQNSANINTREELAKQAGVSHDTIAKTENIIKTVMPEQ